METKILLRLIKDDIKILEGINESLIGQVDPTPEEVEVALARARALVLEFEMLSKNLEREEPEGAAELHVKSESKESNGKPEKKSQILRNFLPFIKSKDENTPEPISSDSQEKPEKEPVSENEVIIAEKPLLLIEEQVSPLIEEAVSQETKSATVTELKVQSVETTETQVTTTLTEVKIESGILTEEGSTDKKTLGEILGEKHQLVNDLLSPEKIEGKYETKPLKSIRDGIGINDRFLYMKELFHNNPEKYEHAISSLDELTTIEEAVQFLKLNFKWSKSDAGQKFLLLVKRRFAKN